MSRDARRLRGRRRSLIWCVAAALVVAGAVSGMLLLGRGASVSGSATHGASKIASARSSPAFQPPEGRHSVSQTGAGARGNEVQLRHRWTPCLTTTGRRLCGWAAAKHCNRTLLHATTKVLKRSLGCIRLLRQFNAQRTTQYVLTQESHE